jgi:hypothetical protein
MRLRRTLENALTGSTYLASHAEEPRSLVLEALRGRKRVTVVFRGVRDSSTKVMPEPGSALTLKSIRNSGGWSWRRILLPMPTPHSFPQAQRVTIRAGATDLQIDCEDADWWEDDEAPDDRGSTS